jgi:hypothetical protein
LKVGGEIALALKDYDNVDEEGYLDGCDYLDWLFCNINFDM